MAEYIDREALIAEYDRVHKGEAGGARKLMVDAPAADVAEVRHGRWVKIQFAGEPTTFGYRCSECILTNDIYTSYCPWCGAKMDGKGEGE